MGSPFILIVTGTIMSIARITVVGPWCPAITMPLLLVFIVLPLQQSLPASVALLWSDSVLGNSVLGVKPCPLDPTLWGECLVALPCAVRLSSRFWRSVPRLLEQAAFVVVGGEVYLRFIHPWFMVICPIVIAYVSCFWRHGRRFCNISWDNDVSWGSDSYSQPGGGLGSLLRCLWWFGFSSTFLVGCLAQMDVGLPASLLMESEFPMLVLSCCS